MWQVFWRLCHSLIHHDGCRRPSFRDLTSPCRHKHPLHTRKGKYILAPAAIDSHALRSVRSTLSRLIPPTPSSCTTAAAKRTVSPSASSFPSSSPRSLSSSSSAFPNDIQIPPDDVSRAMYGRAPRRLPLDADGMHSAVSSSSSSSFVTLLVT